MPVPFKELGGSPTESYGLDGFQAERRFLIAWEDRDAFAVDVLGVVTEYGGRTWASYPGKSSVFAVSLHYEPFDPNGLDPQAFTDLTTDLNSYSNSLAKAVVKYRTVNLRDRTDGPENEIGTYLTYRMSYATVEEPITPQGWVWVDQPTLPAPEDLALVKVVPVTEHELVWQQVVRPPWDTIRQLQGKLNSTEFLSCPAGTLLFVGAKANKLYRSGFDAGESDFCWEIAYLFREKAIKQGGQTYGWNHAYRDDPAGWAELTNGSSLLYDTAEFLPLFQSASD